MNTENKNEIKSKLSEITDILYKGDVNQGIASFGEVLPFLAQIADETADSTRYVEEILKPILEAMERKDGTEMADIINYELIEYIENI